MSPKLSATPQLLSSKFENRSHDIGHASDKHLKPHYVPQKNDYKSNSNLNAKLHVERDIVESNLVLN
jgi:hypothetical protein